MSFVVPCKEYACLPFLCHIEGVPLPTPPLSPPTPAVTVVSTASSSKKRKKQPSAQDDARREYLLASSVVRADDLCKKNAKRSPADMTAVIAHRSLKDHTPLQLLCDGMLRFLDNVALQRASLSLVRPQGRKRYKWMYKDTIRLRALLPVLRSAFYPHGIKRSAKSRCSSDTWIGSAVDDAIQQHFRETSPYRFVRYADSLSCADECQRYLGVTVGEFGEEDEQSGGKGVSSSEIDAKQQKRRDRFVSIYANAIIAELTRKGIVLTAVQVPVFDPAQRIVSFIDAVGICISTCRPVVLEFKTGYDYGYTQASGRMIQPLESVSCSPKKVHMMQLAWYVHACAGSRYGLEGLSTNDGYVLKVNSKNSRVKAIVSHDGTQYEMNGEWFRLEPWTRIKRVAIAEKLVASALPGARSRKKKRVDIE